MVKDMLSKRTNEQILNDWIELDKQEVTMEIAMVRGWMMDELEKRFPEEFNAWLEGDWEKDYDITHYIKL